MNRYLITYETKLRGEWHPLADEISAPGHAQAATVAGLTARELSCKFPIRVKKVQEID